MRTTGEFTLRLLRWGFKLITKQDKEQDVSPEGLEEVLNYLHRNPL
jgi:hypothetical protein